MKKIILTSILLFQLGNLFSQEFMINVTAESRNDYKINGNDSEGSINGFDPDLNFKAGSKLLFKIKAPGHPFLIKLKPGTGKKNLVENISNNGIAKGTIEWVPIEKGIYYYQCIKHKNMVGRIIIF